MLIRIGEALAIGWSRNMLYLGFSTLPRSVFRRQTGFAARITRPLSRSTNQSGEVLAMLGINPAPRQLHAMLEHLITLCVRAKNMQENNRTDGQQLGCSQTDRLWSWKFELADWIGMTVALLLFIAFVTLLFRMPEMLNDRE